MRRHVVFSLAPMLILLSGCFPASVPTQTRPSCSWASTTPRNADTICQSTFQTLKVIAAAEQQGDNRTIRRLVPAAQVADRIIAYGQTLRAEDVHGLHIVPSFTLDALPGRVGAGFYLLGKTRQGEINSQETVYLLVRHGTATVVGDQPGQEW